MYALEKKYPCLEVDLGKLRHNINEMIGRCAKLGIRVTGVTKGCNGLVEAGRAFEECGSWGLASSRLEHIAEARESGLKGPFMSLRVPMISEARDLVALADISLNSDLDVLRAIDREAARQGKTHGVLLMSDLGDLREGWWDKDEMVAAAETVERELTHLHLYGVGVNLGCYGSINPSVGNMLELIEIAERIEKRIGRELEIISGGATTSLPLVLNGSMPRRINHLRMGEGILVGKDLDDIWNLDMSFINLDIFKLKAEVIEVRRKPSYPVGDIFVDCYGKKPYYEDRGVRKRALVAVGKLDFALTDSLIPTEKGIEVLGGSSDHLILDVEDCARELRAGDVLTFETRYSTMMYLTSSRYVRVEYVNG